MGFWVLSNVLHLTKARVFGDISPGLNHSTQGKHSPALCLSVFLFTAKLLRKWRLQQLLRELLGRQNPNAWFRLHQNRQPTKTTNVAAIPAACSAQKADQPIAQRQQLQTRKATCHVHFHPRRFVTGSGSTSLPERRKRRTNWRQCPALLHSTPGRTKGFLVPRHSFSRYQEVKPLADSGLCSRHKMLWFCEVFGF